MGGSAEVAVTAAPVPSRRRRFTGFHRSDRNFFLVFVLVCWLGIVVGFFPPALQRFQGHARFPAPLILKVHAVAFMSWFGLLTGQTLLVRRLNTRLHMKLGMGAVALVPVMAVSTWFSEIYTQRWHLAHPPDNFPFLIHPIFWVVNFTALATAALVWRKDPGSHKRLILLASTIIAGAAYGRWWGDALFRWFGDGLGGMLINTYAPTDLILFGALAYDWWTRGRLHPAYEIAVPAILLEQIGTSFIYHSPHWIPIASYLVSG